MATASPLAPQPSIGPAPTPPTAPQPTTSAEKIMAAEQAGAIDHETAVVARVLAAFGDPRLPADLRGTRSEDLVALDDARELLATASPANQAILRSYLVRPTHAESYWNQEPPATAGVELAVAQLRRPAAPSRNLAAPACTNGWMSTQVSPNIPVMVWSQCFGSATDAQAALEEARGYMATLWGPETNLMGVPPGDQNVPDDDWDDMPETGDGLIDIYLLDNYSPSGHVRDFDLSGAYAVTASTPPIAGPANALTTAGYIVVMPGLRGLDLESTLAHEFFHVLQYAHNKQGLWDCIVGSLGAACTTDTPRTSYWMTEASATWAEHRFVPAARATKDGPYDRFHEWRKTNMGLSQTANNNAYHSWMWPLFVQEQASQTAIANIWRAYEGKHGFQQLQAATDSVMPFAQQFREFAIRGWNELLNPGDPLQLHYFDQSLDGAFPRDQPEDGRLIDPIDLDAQRQGPHIEYVLIDSLATRYQTISPSGDTHTIVLDFTALAPEIDVDGIVYLADGTWERRKLDGQVTWCLDKPADAVQLAYLVFSDHDLDPGLLTRTWSWEARQEGCGVTIGTLAYTFVDTAPLTSFTGGRVSIQASVTVHLKANENVGNPYNAMYLNDGSAYGVQMNVKSLGPPGPDGCQITSISTGLPGGGLEIDSVVGNTWVDEDGRNRLTLGIGLPVHLETDENWCALGAAHSTSESGVTFPECDGVEIASTDTTQTFKFDCDFQGTSQSWSMGGTIVIDR
jgi:hypothetical protein